MAVLFDMSARSVLVFCTDCPWRDIVTTTGAATRIARDHLYDVHPGDDSKTNRDNLSARGRRARVADPATAVG